MAFNILEPEISRVAKGLDGKIVMVYGGNNLGKTLQGTRMEKPLVLPFEHGLNAIAGIPHFPINSWSDFKKVNMSLTNPRSIDKVKEMYQTIIFDEIEASANYCQEYICRKYDAETIGSGNDGWGLWKEYETEYWREINRLTKSGFTVYFIAHEQVDRDTKQVVPKGDKRALAPIQNLADVVVYLQSAGIDEDGKVIKSVGYTAETPEFFARSRFDYMDTMMEEYTAENLATLFETAITRQEEADGVEAVTHEEQSKMKETELDYDTLMEDIKEQFLRLKEQEKTDKYLEVVEEELGEGAIVSEVPKSKVQSLDLILFQLKDVE